MALLHDNQTEWNRKTVLFVHGIGIQPAGFSEPLYKILHGTDPATADATRWHEIAYERASDLMKQKLVELQQFIPAPGKPPAAKEVVAEMVTDLVSYLGTESLYDWINNLGRKALMDALQQGIQSGVLPEKHQLFIIAHSLGTVVSYELFHTIVNDPQVPGLSSGVKIRAYLTMGSPLAFIKANQAKIPTLNHDAFLRRFALGRPWLLNPFGEQETNVSDWFNYRHSLDPVASLVPVDQNSANDELSRETSVFEAFHAGLNAHDFSNYITEYRTEIMNLLHG